MSPEDLFLKQSMHAELLKVVMVHKAIGFCSSKLNHLCYPVLPYQIYQLDQEPICGCWEI